MGDGLAVAGEQLPDDPEEALKPLQILSPCFYPTVDPAELLVQSAERFHLPLALYGVGDTFITHGADAQVKRLLELMDQEKLADLVMVTDCRDVLLLAREEEIIRKYRAYSKDGARTRLVMSAERGCWPPDEELVFAGVGVDINGYCWANAGQFIGEWDYVKDCLRLLLERYRGKHPGADNSQGWWMWARLREEVDYVLDSGCQIFQSMSGGADSHTQVVDGVLMNTVTGSRPCSVHFNGNPGNDIPVREMYWRIFR